MPRTPTIFGISMSSRNRRRWLVLFCYVFWGLLTLFVPFQISETARIFLILLMSFAFAFIPFVVFYGLARDTVLPMQEDPRPISLGLLRKALPDNEKLDERQVAVRNAAYYKAYRFIAAFVLFTPMILGAMTLSRTVLWIYMCSIMTLLYSLPQAIILWTEPDMPGETV